METSLLETLNDDDSDKSKRIAELVASLEDTNALEHNEPDVIELCHKLFRPFDNHWPDDELWPPPSNEGRKVYVKWLRRPLYIHQALNICWTLLQMPKSAGAIIADEPGNGKTLTAIGYMTIVAVIERLHIHRAEHPEEHCRKGGLSTCPTKAKYWLPNCPCEKDAPLWIRPKPEGVQLAFTLPPVVNQFIREICRYWPRPSQIRHINLSLKLVVGHGEINKLQKRYKSGGLTIMNAMQARNLAQQSGAASIIVLTTTQSFNSQVRDKLTPKGSQLQASTVVIDEMHKISRPTSAFWKTTLGTSNNASVAVNSYNLVALTATPQETGPRDLAGFLTTVYEKIKKRKLGNRLGWANDADTVKMRASMAPEKAIKTHKDFERLQNSYAKAVLNNEDTTGLVEEIKKIGTTHAANHSFYTIKHKKGAYIPLLSPPEKIRELPAIVKEDLIIEPREKDLQRLNDQARKGIVSVAKDIDPDTKEDLDRKLLNNFFRLCMCKRPLILAPHVQVMLDQGLVQRTHLNQQTMAEHGWFHFEDNGDEKYQNVFMDHACSLYKSSLRIQKMASIWIQQLEEWDQVKAKGENKRRPKIMIVTQSPASSLIIYAALRQHFSGKNLDTKVFLVSSALTAKDKVTAFERFNETVEQDEDGNAVIDPKTGAPKRTSDGNIDILIGTVGVVGTGLSFSRCNTIILAEAFQKQRDIDQTVNRCHRLDQTEPCRVYMMKSERLIFEKRLTNRLKLRQLLLSQMDDLNRAKVQQIFDRLDRTRDDETVA